MRPFVSSEVPHVNIAIFTATRWEFQAVVEAFTVERTTTMAGVRCAIGRRGKAHVSVWQSGIGLQKAAHVSLAALGHASWDLVVSSGFAGALVPCAVGTLVVGDEVQLGEASEISKSREYYPILCDDIFRSRAFQVSRSIDQGSQCGHIVSLSRIIGTSTEKKIVADHTHAVALDMESASLGSVARSHHIPFIVVRTISDLWDEDLPIDFNLFLHPRDWVKGVGAILRNPASLFHIVQFQRQVAVASRRLTMFFKIFFDEMEHAS
ncbi:MAG: 5'-methylthioadenosine/S-adenosylhomocysteine nucleosidase [Nitrospirales bacterium]|nr:MAG: 5'-methylthioadenosine/S-adenosylhomocysteine nucleosidase [Nitrospirales bacterium]